MFELFGKANISKENYSTGVGLGLTYCKKVIQQAHFSKAMQRAHRDIF